MITWVLGIDPGISGAIALVDPDGRAVKILRPTLIQEVKNNKIRNKLNLALTVVMLRELNAEVEAAGGKLTVCMEDVSSQPTDGAIQAFTFGKNVGQWEALIVALGLPYRSVHSSVWKKEMVAKTVAIPKLPEAMSEKQKSRVKASVTKARKFAAVDVANKLYPEHATLFSKTGGDGPAEAVLIAEWARRRENSVPIVKKKVEKIIIPIPALDPVEPPLVDSAAPALTDLPEAPG
jgi:hypothetical protein